MKIEYSRHIEKKNPGTSNLIKIRPVGAELFRADRRTTMMKLIIAIAILRTRLKVYITALSGEVRREMCNKISYILRRLYPPLRSIHMQCVSSV